MWIFSLMCQSVNLLGKDVQNVGCVSSVSVADTKIIFRYNFLSSFNPLKPGFTYLQPLENIRKPLGFLIFLEGIDKQQRAVIG